MNPKEFDPAWSEVDQVNWFLVNFAMIPEERWCIHTLHSGDRSCALGHCGARDYCTGPVADALDLLFSRHLGALAPSINDNGDECPPCLQQITTPKARIVRALEIISEKISGRTITEESEKI